MPRGVSAQGVVCLGRVSAQLLLWTVKIHVIKMTAGIA